MPLSRLDIPKAIIRELIEHAVSELPNECCGVLAGFIEDGVGRATAAHPLVNELKSPHAFRTESRSLFMAHRAMRQAGTDILAIYHSHPASDAAPSLRDLAENTYGSEVAWVIVSLSTERPGIGVWWLTEHDYTKAVWRS